MSTDHYHYVFTILSLLPSIMCLQKLQQELEFLEVQEEYIKDEQKNLKKEFLHAQEEVKRIQSIPLVIGQFLEAVDQNTAIVGSTTGITGTEFRGIQFLHTCWKALLDSPLQSSCFT